MAAACLHLIRIQNRESVPCPISSFLFPILKFPWSRYRYRYLLFIVTNIGRLLFDIPIPIPITRATLHIHQHQSQPHAEANHVRASTPRLPLMNFKHRQRPITRRFTHQGLCRHSFTYFPFLVSCKPTARLSRFNLCSALFISWIIPIFAARF